MGERSHLDIYQSLESCSNSIEPVVFISDTAYINLVYLLLMTPYQYVHIV